jgi:hypothetical protein
MRIHRLGLAAAGIAVLPVAGAAAGPGVHASACEPGIRDGVDHFCGPATAHLGVKGSDVFRQRFTFRPGKCKRERVNGERETTIELGRIKVGDAVHNGGLPYIKIGISGPFSNPSSGYVIAYRKGKRWSGLGTSLTRDRTHGGWKFKASPTGGSHGAGSGRFTC